jgi:PadR family transcriptional regulator PadR
MYGYEILQEATRCSGDGFELKEGTLYPALRQVERKGLLRAAWKTGENGRARKYYALTAKGRKTADKYERQWRHLAGATAAVPESN